VPAGMKRKAGRKRKEASAGRKEEEGSISRKEGIIGGKPLLMPSLSLALLLLSC